MPFYKEQIKKHYDGNTLVPLTVQDEILKIRSKIEKSEQHSGETLELCYQAYKEIKEVHGGRPKKLDSKCSSCIMEINLLLNNWLKMYDNRIFHVPEKKNKLKPLKPKSELSDNQKQPETTEKKKSKYELLLEKFKAVASPEVQREINGGKLPSTKQLNEYFNNLKNQNHEQ